MIRTLSFILMFMALSSVAYAESMFLTVLEDEIVVYTGPSRNYRSLTTLPKNTKVSAAVQTVSGTGESFYKVLVTFKGNIKRVGFISTNENVKVDRDQAAEELDRYTPLALAESSMQTGFYTLRGTNYFWTIGFLKYPAPSFYVKVVGGQFLSRTASSVILGGGLGTDHFVTQFLSFYTDFQIAGLFAPRDNLFFEGSNSFNTFIQGGVGLRYNAELAAVSLGILQALVLNGNNSYLSWGGGMTLEVGL